MKSNLKGVDISRVREYGRFERGAGVIGRLWLQLLFRLLDATKNGIEE